MPMPALFEAMRPRQWTKNVFVLAGIVFAGRLFDRNAQLRVVACFALFCAISSAIYLANDLADRASDVHHPLKRTRPIASGRVSPATAWLLSAVLAAAALAGAALLNLATFGVFAAYLISTLGYSLRLKRVFLVDVMIVASGFVLRAVAGAACIAAEISPWLLVCSFLLALFLALGKRRAELVLLGQNAPAHRPALGQYSVPLLDGWLTALAGAVIVSYAIYTQSERTVAHFGTTNLVYTVPFVIYALFRYQQHVVREDAGGDPGSLLAQDRALWVALLGWAITAAAVIYR
ncbi:MAG TPA: decaprenyl-phosphate phosphoribosyltransferase [Gaiellales bacterium]|nr:decaprenyl-phosphate phosphoribosyltransferase [Gaiellales bacterium]HZX95677.1 decaprenyl-phosphate phosphoribosyltransferase [Myxococcales bacterium]